MRNTSHRKTRNSGRNRSRNWRNTPDNILCLGTAVEDVAGRLVFIPAERAESLCPDASTVERAAFGDARATAIVYAWRFAYPVLTEG